MKKRRQKNKKEYRIRWIAILTVLVFCMLIWESGAQKGSSVIQKVNLFQSSDSTAKPTVGTDPEPESEEMMIRVLLKTNGFADLFHGSVSITSKQKYTVTVDGKKTSYNAGKKVHFKSGDKKWKGRKVVIEPTSGKRLQVLSIKRQGRCPEYRGRMEITWKSQGFLVCNILSLEQYLYAVVPSELSTGNKMEALKAQAICARSYACNQIKSQRYDRYYADVDDSVAFQVYNNVPEDRRSREAVNSTEGIVLTRDGQIVQTYYYSTSWGYTANGKDVWNTKNDIPYLQSKFQITTESRKKTAKRRADLSGEDDFLSFLDHPGCETYDSKAPWYRWSVMIGQQSLSARIDGLLSSVRSENPELVLTQTKTGRYVNKPLKTVGTVKKIRVEHRKESGLVTEIVIVGSKNVVKVITQYNIRKVLAPVYESITYGKDKSTMMDMLPSAAFCIGTVTEGEKVSFLFSGGGLGHGAGLSQCGAARMAQLGKDYKEILLHYFSGTELVSVGDLQGTE